MTVPYRNFLVLVIISAVTWPSVVSFRNPISHSLSRQVKRRWLTQPRAVRLDKQVVKHYSKGLKLEYPPDKVALVTGSGRGIGECIAKRLAQAGVSSIICVDIDADAATEVSKAIDASVEKDGTATSFGVDVGDPDAVASLCDEIISKHGGVDILVNNAGITRDNLLMRMSNKEWESVINVNLNSCFYFTKPFIRGMSKKHWGRVINVASVVGIGGNAGQANYAASKAGMIGLAKSIAKEMGSKGITANAIAPGFIRTTMTDKLSDEQKVKLAEQIPANRLGEADEIGDLVAYLASNQASYVNGHVIPIDGGMMFGYP